MLRLVERKQTSPGLGLDALWSGALDALVIPDALPFADAVAARLDGPQHLPRLRFGSQFEAWSYGRGLDRAGADLDGFFAAVDPFLVAAEGLLGDLFSPVDWIHSTLGGLTGGEGLSVPRRGGQSYLPFTIRCLPPGGLLPAHAELEQIGRSPYVHLRDLLEPATLLSWLVMLRPAEAGGAVRVWDLRFADLGTGHFHRGHTAAEGLLHGRACTDLSPPAGALLIFDGGRNVHAVTPVEGSTNRWTMGGFLARRPDGPGWWAWA